jgi:glycosyltransferase involved in cell wall biosynthesis
VSDAIYPFFKGGKEVRYHELIAHLVAAGVHVDVYTMHWWDGPRERHQDGVTYRAICKVWPMYVHERRSIIQALAFAVATLKLMFRPFDLIDADHMPYLQLLPLRLVASFRRRPLIVSWHEWWGKAYWTEYLGKAGPVAASVERLSARLADHIVTMTVGTEAKLCSAGVPATRVSVHPLGVNRASIEAAPPSDMSYDVVYVGRLIQHKGVDVLLRALAQLRDEGTTATCGIAGTGPEEGRLRGLCAALDLDRQVDFLGHLESRVEVFGLIKAARLFAYPSVREGYGLAVAEALACGTLVVTFDHPENEARHLLGADSVSVACQPTVAGLAEALLSVLSVDTSVTAAPGTDRVQDWGSRAEDLLRLYRAQVRSHMSVNAGRERSHHP